MPAKKKKIHLEWNVLRYNHNDREFEVFNVFNHWSFREYLEKLLTDKNITREYFEERLRREVMYCYWSKTEWECIVTDTKPHIKRKELDRIIDECYQRRTIEQGLPRCEAVNLSDSEKIDVYDQVNLNWEAFVEYVWGFAKAATRVQK